MKKIIAFLLTIVMLLSLCPVVMAEEEVINQPVGSVQLKTLGNKLVFANDESVQVHLTGVNVCGSEWMANPESERVKRGVKEAIYNWDANIIRMGVSLKGWWGEYSWVDDGGNFYRSYIEDVIETVHSSGKYIILDLHEYDYMSKRDLQFWKEAAETFGNNPAVLFGLLNEPCGSTTWETWRNGDGGDNVGLQHCVETIRDMGAKNIIVAGGISYSGTLAQIGIDGGYDLIDQGSNGDKTKTGYGIMYDIHIYPAHGNTDRWHRDFGVARSKYPIIVGEFGWDAEDSVVMGNAPQENNPNYHTRWFPEMYDWMEDELTYGAKANWTAWCFHPSSSPRMLEKTDANGVSFGEDGYIYTPTPWFGAYIKEWLREQRGVSLTTGKNIVSYTSGRPANSTDASLALDGDKTTSWQCANTKTKELVVDLGNEYKVNRWQVYHKNTLYNYSLSVSLDGNEWKTVDTHINERAEVSDKYFKSTTARYVKLTINDADDISAVYEFNVIVDNGADGYINTDGYVETSGVMLYQTGYDFYNGDEMPCWWSTTGVSPTYVANASQDGEGSVMRFKDANSRMMVLQGVTDSKGYDWIELKYKSDMEITLEFQVDFRVQGVKYVANRITLYTTDGEWKTVKIYPEDLMKSADDTWVYDKLYTKYDLANANFDPVLVAMMNTKTNGTADFEYFNLVWTMEDAFNFESVRVLQNELPCDSLSKGKADFYIRYVNHESRRLMDMLAVVAIYDAKGNLVSMEALPFNAGINVFTKEHKLTLDIPSDGCTAKIITWRSANGMIPVTNVVEF